MVIVFALLILGVGFYLMQSFLNMDSLVDTEATVLNELDGSINSTGYTLAGASTSGANSFSITDAVNETGDPIATGNWSVSSVGVVLNITYESWNNVTFNYTYNYGSEAYAGMNQTMEAFGDIPNLMGLVILIILVGIIVTILLGIGKKTGEGA